MDWITPLLKRTLVLVAHPDDEAVGCGILLQRMREPVVVFAINAAPRADFFWRNYGSRECYARVRAHEAKESLDAIGVSRQSFLCPDPPIADQELYLNLGRAFDALCSIIEAQHPAAILTHAYEGGHPDHDACSFLAAVAGEKYQIPVWEMPLYNRASGQLRRQRFVSGEEQVAIEPSSAELVRKRMMFAAHRSQSHVIGEFAPEPEHFRPMPAYNFARPPHEGAVNYEAWQWPMTSSDLCRAFSDFLATADLTRREWGTAA